MNVPHDKFCVLPWISLETSPVGTVRPCCLAIDEIVDDTGNKFKLNQASFQEIQNSKHMRGLREQFLNGEQPQTCERCWSEERAGRTSKRMHSLDRLKHMGISDDWTTDAKPLMFLDLKLGNICNLKCRICGSWSSSQFAAEELAFISDREEKKTSFHYQMLRDGAWPRESEQFWAQLDSAMSEVRYIEFTGGEPFMIREHFDLLKKLIQRNYAHQIEIHYNTNGTQYPEDAEEIWQYFKHVEVAFSIDDVGSRFEYQRTNAVWSEVCNNIARFRDMRDRNLNMSLQVCCTVNVFNVMYLEAVAQWIDTQDFDFVYWNMLHDARHFSINTLPKHTKVIIANQLINAKVNDTTREQLNHIVDFMNNHDSSDGQLLKQQIDLVDRRRNENFAETFPELAQALHNE